MVESTKKHPAPPANANVPLDKPSTEKSAPSHALLASFTAKPKDNAPVLADIIGTEAFVSFASVEKPGTAGSKFVSALITKLGTDIHVITHAQVEEFWMMPMDNVSVPLVTGMVLLVSSAPTIKSGPIQKKAVLALMATGTVEPVLGAPLTKFGTQPTWPAAVPGDKTRTVSDVSPAPLDKNGTKAADHVDVHPVKTGTDPPVSHVSVEDNGTASQKNAYAPSETGTASHAFSAPPGKDGIDNPSHAHAPPIPTGTVATAKLAQAPVDSGIIN